MQRSQQTQTLTLSLKLLMLLATIHKSLSPKGKTITAAILCVSLLLCTSDVFKTISAQMTRNRMNTLPLNSLDTKTKQAIETRKTNMSHQSPLQRNTFNRHTSCFKILKHGSYKITEQRFERRFKQHGGKRNRRLTSPCANNLNRRLLVSDCMSAGENSSQIINR